MELCIVLAIIGILTAISVPFYTKHVVRSERIAAEITLKKIASGLEDFYTIHNTYEGASLSSLGFESTKNYTLRLRSNEMEYTVMAVPEGTQAIKDALCGTLTLNSLGEIGITGTSDVKQCW